MKRHAWLSVIAGNNRDVQYCTDAPLQGRHRMPVACLVLLVVTMSGCATRSTAPDPDAGSRIGAAVTAPLEDLNLIRTRIPEVLIEAEKNPYQPLEAAECAAIEVEVAALDEALGPDMDARWAATEESMWAKGGAMVGDSAIGALRGTTTGVLPFHGWVRKLTGAERHSREVANAIAAGIVRRAYLKGIGVTLGCKAPAAPLQPAVIDVQESLPVRER